MATELLMPRQGNTVESCLILDWRKTEGDQVHAGDIVCEVETDKATFEVEADTDGTLLKILFEAGTDVPVLTPIALIGQQGEDISTLIPDRTPAAKEAEKKPVTVEASLQPPVMTQTAVPASAQTSAIPGFIKISPRARHLAAAKGLNVSGISGTGPGGRIIERDILAILAEKAPLTPAAIAAQIEKGMHVPLKGSGIGGRITTGDLLSAPAVEAPEEKVLGVPTEFPGPTKDIPVKSVRKIIASRMLESLQTTAQLTLNASADASKLLSYRKRLKESPEELGLTGITINDLVLYAVAKTLPRFPFMNAHFLGETIKEFEHVHLGIAVDLPRGLMVPVLRYADTLSLKQLAGESKRLITACQQGKILPDELTGGTFTITNLGTLGIESFTPVLNSPEAGILGVCAIQPKPVMADNGEVSYVPSLGLSLTINHQAVDGAPAARFLKELSTALANVDLLLAG